MTTPAIPDIRRPVTDTAEVFSGEQHRQITALLLEHEERTGVKVAVLTIETTGRTPIEEYSIRVVARWKVMAHLRGPHALLVLAVADRNIDLVLSDSIESVAPTLSARRLLKDIGPELAERRYADGLRESVRAIMHATKDFRPGEGAPLLLRARGLYLRARTSVLFCFLLGILSGVGLCASRARMARCLQGHVPAPLPRQLSWAAILGIVWPLATVVVSRVTAERIAIIYALGALQGLVLAWAAGRVLAPRRAHPEHVAAAARAGVFQLLLIGPTLSYCLRESGLDSGSNTGLLSVIIVLLEALVLLSWWMTLLKYRLDKMSSERLLALSATLKEMRGCVVAINAAAAVDGSLRDLDRVVAAIEKKLAELQG